MSRFARGQQVVKLLRGGGVVTASTQEVDKVEAGRVALVSGGGIMYADSTGREIDPAVPGFMSELVYLEGGDPEGRWAYIVERSKPLASAGFTPVPKPVKKEKPRRR